MRLRSMFLVPVAVLAAVQVLGVLVAAPFWRFAEVAALVLLSAYAGIVARPRWLGPVALSPLLLDALLTVPPPRPATYGWQFLSPAQQPPHLVLDALDQGFRSGGPALLAVLALLLAHRTAEGPSGRTAGATAEQPSGRLKRAAARPPLRLIGVAVAGLGIVGYAVVRVGRIVDALHGHPTDGTSGVAVAVAVLVPVSLALAALALAGKATGWATPIGGVLIAAATLPMIDSMIGTVPMPYRVNRGEPGLFGWDAITPTLALPAPVPALTEALFLAGILCAVAGLSRSPDVPAAATR